MDIKVKAGCTRVVILYNTIAIKIALPFRPLAPLFIIFNEIMKGTLRNKLNKYEGGIFQIVMRVVFTGGVDSNRREIRISQEHPEYPIARVLRSYLGGYIIVMIRGEEIKMSYCPWDIDGSLPKNIRESDLFYPRNSCRIGKKYYFVDYGDPSAEEILQLLFKTECRP